jgi:transcriptional regulator CtsR
VFISHVWKQHQQDHPDSRLSLEEFKSQLLQAHQEGSLELSRADMAHALDQTDVAQSEIQYLSATFHFVTLD